MGDCLRSLGIQFVLQLMDDFRRDLARFMVLSHSLYQSEC